MEEHSAFDKFESTMNYNNTTSPSQLQEVTLDPDATNFSYFGMRSPGAPTNCRSVKEIDEQLTNLRKENFNLKLRIYFLEERMGANFNTDKEDAMKKNIELMVELENLRKDLEDKQELLCQAAKALEIEEEERKKEVAARDRDISDLRSELDELRHQIRTESKLREENNELALCAQAFNLDLNVAGSADFVKNLQDTILDLQMQLAKEQERGDHLQSLLDLTKSTTHRFKSIESGLAEKMSAELEEERMKVVSYSHRMEILEDEIRQKSDQLQNMLMDIRQKDCDLGDHIGRITDLSLKLDACTQQKEKLEKKTEKCKAIMFQYEAKHNDLLSYVETLQTKIQTLESKLQSLQARKDRSPVIHAPPDLEFLRTRTPSPHPETPKTSKDPRMTSKSVHRTSANSTSSSTKSHSPMKFHTPEAGENILCPIKKNTSNSESYDSQLSQEEVVELKKNHYKACKMIKAMLQKKNEYVDQIEQLQAKLNEKGSEIRELQEKMAEIEEFKNEQTKKKKKSIQELVSEKNFTATSNPAATNKEAMMATDGSDLAQQYKELATELENKIEVLNATMQEKDGQLERLSTELQAKVDRIIDLEFELLTLNQGVSGMESGEKVEKLLQEQDEKEKEIKRLDSELRKRTCDLQGIVNKELWEKNRAIEKLQTTLKHKDQEMEQLEKNSHNKELQLKILKEKINELGIHVNLPPSLLSAESQTTNLLSPLDAQDQLKILTEERRHHVQEIKDLKQQIKNMPEHDENQLVQLKVEYSDLRDELEKSEKIRQEQQELCLILSTRLEELCHFLDSLLKNKSVLGFLGSEQSMQLQNAIGKSLDLSRTLSATFSQNPDQSLFQLSNITNLLNSTRNESFSFNLDVPTDMDNKDEENNTIFSIIPTDITLTYRSHLNRTTNPDQQVITVLREQVANLKHEVELRDIELAKRNGETFDKLNVSSTTTLVAEKKNLDENQSESESWSEPDRAVSIARIGLHDESLRRPSGSISRRKLGSNVSSESTEGEQGSGRTPSKKVSLAESRQTILALHEQVCELEVKLKDKENQLLAAQLAYYEMDKLAKQEQAKVEETLRTNVHLSMQVTEANKKYTDCEQQKRELERKMKEAQEEFTQDLQEAKQRFKEAEQQKLAAEKKISDLQAIVATLEGFKKNAESTMDVKNKEMQNCLNEMQIEKDKAIEAAKQAEQLLENTNSDLQAAEDELQGVHLRQKELEENYKNSIMATEEQHQSILNNIKYEHENQIKHFTETIDQIKEICKKEHIQKSDVDQRVLEVDRITKELDNLKKVMHDADVKMQMMQQHENELNKQVQKLQLQHRAKIQELQSELDNSTLQYSEVILEKTKLQNEVAMLENKVVKFCGKESDLVMQLNNLNKEVQQTQSDLQIKISHLEKNRSQLEARVAKLDNVNTELLASNAELSHQLIKLQVGRTPEGISSTSLPGNVFLNTGRSQPMPIAGHYSRQLSDNSGYTSEDIPLDDFRSIRSPMHAPDLERERERVRANASPDLGIESDHGRFSSLEANINVPRPLLPTLELTQSMSNLLDPVQDDSCANDECCTRTKQMASENVELRKRLLRTRRALEETLNRLTLANRQKKEVEKSICKQIHKTSQVLRKAKANLDSGSDTDFFK